MKYSINLTLTSCFILSLLCITSRGHAQGNQNHYPNIGDRCPDFVLDNLYYYGKSNASYQDFKGKPIILNFFSTGCGSSFESLPHLKEMQQKFEGRVHFILIGRGDPELKKQYEKYRIHYGLNFPVDFDDSALWNKFGVYFVAHTIWIDASGIICQITTPYGLNEERINNLLTGKSQKLSISGTLSDYENTGNGNIFYDPAKPYLAEGNGGSDTSFIYRSIFSKWDYRTGFLSDNYISSKNNNKLFETGVSLLALYKLAYGDTVEFQMPMRPVLSGFMENNTYSEWSTIPILETKKRDLFTADYFTGQNVFTFSLNLPDSIANSWRLKKVLQNELQNYFGFNVKVEYRSQPCWKLFVDKNKAFSLNTSGGQPVWYGGFSNLSLKNMPVSALIHNIWGFNQDTYTFIDETGIKGNIDLDVDCIWTDLEDVKKALQKKGLNLVKSEAQLKVLVIRD